MSLIKDIKNIINNNKLVFVFILGLLTCYLIFNCGSCKEGYSTKEACLSCCSGEQSPGTPFSDYEHLCIEGKDDSNNSVWGCINPIDNHPHNNGPCGRTKTVMECDGTVAMSTNMTPEEQLAAGRPFNAQMFNVSVDTTDFNA